MISWDGRGRLGAWKRVQPPVCSRCNKVRPTQMIHATVMHAPAWEGCPLIYTGTGCWNVGYGEHTHRGDCCRLWGDNMRGQEWGPLQWEMFMEETPIIKKQSAIAACLLSSHGRPCFHSTREDSHLEQACMSLQSPPLPAASHLGDLISLISASVPSCLTGKLILITYSRLYVSVPISQILPLPFSLW